MTDAVDEVRPLAAIERLFKGQVYRLVRVEPYRRRDGVMTELPIYASRCAACGDPFETVWLSTARWPNRRCDTHKQPRVRV